MNPGTFQGAGLGSPLGTISRYIQTPTIRTSQTISVPPGTQRIEALLCGGGGSGGTNTSYGSGGGFGGCAIVEIPITGSPLQVVIGAGGAGRVNSGNGNPGSPTYVVSAGTRYGEVGGGGAGTSPTHTNIANGRSGGGAGGANGCGGGPPLGRLLWTSYPQQQNGNPGIEVVYSAASAASIGGGASNGVFGGYGIYAPSWSAVQGGSGSFGAGGGSASSYYDGGTQFIGNPGYGAGANVFNQFSGTPNHNGVHGGGAAVGSNTNYTSGGSLTSVSIWGYTGFAGGTGSLAGGGGGGMLGAGGNGASNGGAGGDGGGGGGGGMANATSGAGGNGFAAIRFYL